MITLSTRERYSWNGGNRRCQPSGPYDRIGLSLNGRSWHGAAKEGGAERVRSAPGSSDVDLLRNREGVTDLDPKITDCAFDFGVTKQQLDGA
jgi:hypothetical protein